MNIPQENNQLIKQDFFEKIPVALQQYTILALAGGLIYPLLEIIARGRTHWSMAIAGALAFVLLDLYSSRFSHPLWLKCLFGTIIITAIELIIGIVVNIIFKLNVWDYSDVPLNFLGQICPQFTLLWYLLSAVIFFLCRFIKTNVKPVSR